jgi:N-acyl-D-aspartate/D-glutamate deacylase
VADTTTYTEPTSSPQGIEYVLINGELAVDAGTLVTAGKSGRVIRRGASDA